MLPYEIIYSLPILLPPLAGFCWSVIRIAKKTYGCTSMKFGNRQTVNHRRAQKSWKNIGSDLEHILDILSYLQTVQ